LLEGEARIVLVVNKVDLVLSEGLSLTPNLSPSQKSGDEREIVRVSARTGVGLHELVGLIARVARERIEPGEAPVITQARHREALEDCLRGLQDHIAQDILAAELAAEDLRRAANALGRITGRVDPEQVLDQIFSRFCIGK
jgi:tRNA modification GTPase